MTLAGELDLFHAHVQAGHNDSTSTAAVYNIHETTVTKSRGRSIS